MGCCPGKSALASICNPTSHDNFQCVCSETTNHFDVALVAMPLSGAAQPREWNGNFEQWDLLFIARGI